MERSPRLLWCVAEFTDNVLPVDCGTTCGMPAVQRLPPSLAPSSQSHHLAPPPPPPPPPRTSLYHCQRNNDVGGARRRNTLCLLLQLIIMYLPSARPRSAAIVIQAPPQRVLPRLRELPQRSGNFPLGKLCIRCTSHVLWLRTGGIYWGP